MHNIRSINKDTPYLNWYFDTYSVVNIVISMALSVNIKFRNSYLLPSTFFIFIMYKLLSLLILQVIQMRWKFIEKKLINQGKTGI